MDEGMVMKALEERGIVEQVMQSLNLSSEDGRREGKEEVVGRGRVGEEVVGRGRGRGTSPVSRVQKRMGESATFPRGEQTPTAPSPSGNNLYIPTQVHWILVTSFSK